MKLRNAIFTVHVRMNLRRCSFSNFANITNYLYFVLYPPYLYLNVTLFPVGRHKLLSVLPLQLLLFRVQSRVAPKTGNTIYRESGN
jgi:hypothetical protein